MEKNKIARGKITWTMEQKSIRKQRSEHEGVTNAIRGRGEELGRLGESNEVKLSVKTFSRNRDRDQDAC